MTRFLFILIFFAVSYASGADAEKQVLKAPVTPSKSPITELNIVSLDDFRSFDETPHHPGGWTLEYLKNVLKKKNVQLNVTFLPWTRAFRLASEGKFDGIYPIYIAEERRPLFAFSNPLMEIEAVFFKKRSRSDINYDGTMKSIHGKLVGYTRSAIVSKEFATTNEIRKIDLTSHVEAVRILFLGRIDILASGSEKSTVAAFGPLSQEKGFENIAHEIVRTGPAVARHSVALGWSKARPDWEIKEKLLNDAMKGTPLTK